MKILRMIFIGLLLLVCSISVNANPKKDREVWVNYLDKISRPVIYNLSQGTLTKNMPIENHKSLPVEYSKSVHRLEAVGRTLCGIAPWLELGPDDTKEGKLRKEYIEMVSNGLKNAVDPNSPDHLNFNKYKQPLVDAAFLAQALVRSPKQIWGNLDSITKIRLINEFKSSRCIKPYNNNWLLFSAMVETAIMKFSKQDYEMEPITKALDSIQSWYVGDAVYGDGPVYHFDYYNSFVIQPMTMSILETLHDCGVTKYDAFYKKQSRRYSRYAEELERMISPEGTFPVVGRSIAYRFGVFHALSDAALRKMLVKTVTPSQVRCAMTLVMKNQLKSNKNFDKNGWLTLGFAGHQPSMADSYIATGSTYLCNFAFVALGLSPDDEFWNSPDKDWTNKKAWSGIGVNSDHGLYE